MQEAREITITPWQYRHDSMRIAISGASGLGKTTLSKDLAEFLVYPWIDDGVRKYAEDNSINIRGLSGTARMKFQLELLRRKKAAEHGKQEFIADCSTLDLLAVSICELGNSEKFQRGCMDYVNDCMIHAATHYDAIFVLPYQHGEPEDDGVRSVDMPMKRIMTHMLIDSATAQHGPAFYVHHVRTKTPEERVAECLGVIESLSDVKAKAYAQIMGKPLVKANSTQ